ncbi:D-amino acid dehydrogenase [Elioraea sp. Yellowstone]|uniref:D-amino acid dehydrogenase n=1 Tax=Elioraea sp. Yellowstone TaxID=2592070 RepID=UPI00351BE971
MCSGYDLASAAGSCLRPRARQTGAMHVIVLGAGVVGVAAAWYLREAGLQVTVIEAREGPGLETSFANGGHLSAASGPWAAPDVPGKLIRWIGREDAPLLLRLRWDPALIRWGLRFLANCTASAHAANTAAIGALCRLSAAETVALRDRLGIADETNRAGVLTLYTTEAELAGAADKRTRLAEAGIAAELVDRAGIARLEPALEQAAPRYLGGLFAADTETSDCHLFTAGLADHAARAGVAFRYGARAVAIAVEAGRARGVALAGGETVAADAVVLASGSWSPLLARSVGLGLPVYPGKGYSVTVPIAGRNGAPRIAVVDEHAKLYVARFADRLRVAGTLELAGWDKTPSAARQAATLAKMRALFPEGGDYARAVHWTGLRPMTPDGRPLLGATPIAGLWLDTGHGPLGWTMACGSGRLVAELITGRTPSLDPAAYALARF